MIKARKSTLRKFMISTSSHQTIFLFSKGSSKKIICIFNLDNETKTIQKNNYQYDSTFPSNNLSTKKDYFVFQPYGFGFFNLR